MRKHCVVCSVSVYRVCTSLHNFYVVLRTPLANPDIHIIIITMSPRLGCRITHQSHYSEDNGPSLGKRHILGTTVDLIYYLWLSSRLMRPISQFSGKNFRFFRSVPHLLVTVNTTVIITVYILRTTYQAPVLHRIIERSSNEILVAYTPKIEVSNTGQSCFLRWNPYFTCTTHCFSATTKALNSVRSVKVIFLDTMKASFNISPKAAK